MKKYFIFIISIAIVLVIALGIFYYSTRNIQKFQGIKVLSPNGGEIWSKGQKAQISWSAAEEIESVNIRLAISGNDDSQKFNAAIASDIPNTGNYEWTVQDLYSEVQGIKALPESDKYLVIVEDGEHNNIYDMSDSTFSIR